MDRSRPLHVRASAEQVPDEALVAELRELLAQTGGVEEIARRCGFSDLRHFRRRFSQHFAVSPAALRQ